MMFMQPNVNEYKTFSPGTQNSALLERPLQFVKGVGPVRVELLKRLGLENIRDVLFYFPVAHKDRASVTPIARVKAGSDANIVARIIDVQGKRFGGKEKVVAKLQDDSGELCAGWWNPFVADKLTPNAMGFFSGKVTLFGNKRELSSPEFELLQYHDRENGDVQAGSTGSSFGRIVPVYNLRPKQRLPSGKEAPEIRITQNVLRNIVWQSLEAGATLQLADQLPAHLCQSLGLQTLAQAIHEFHFPQSMESLKAARRRLVFEELFVISLGVALRRAQIDKLVAPKRLPLSSAIQTRIDARLPFQLTASQTRVFREIAADMGSTRPMNRLLQGDVGSGKTAVAVSALLLCVAHGAQSALLAPTEVLAEQHARTLNTMLANSRVKIGLLRGGAKAGQRAELLAQLAAGEIHIAVGTHALLEPGVKFKSLALAIVDEQHKFGVAQRMSLRAKGHAPHVLVMTATPIPRTMTLTLYGDLDVSRIDEFPPGRGEIVTKLLKEHERAKVHKLILEEAKKGHATYVVLPRIDGDGWAPEDDAVSGDVPNGPSGKETVGRLPGLNARQPKKLWSEVKGVEDEIKQLRAAMPALRMDMLHGRMHGEAKDRVLTALRDGNLDVLVSTQVIEVGIDLPSATVMVIENAERFGLAALHQLRGRVGRSARKSYCLIFGEAGSDDSRERLKTFVSTRDGFKIAEADFRLRGPGQFFGTDQSGLAELKIADLLRDTDILNDARQSAFDLVKHDPQLSNADHAGLKRRIVEVLGPRLGLVDVG